MTKGIKAMKELGFIDRSYKHDSIVRQFTKYDDEGFITDAITYFYSKNAGVEVCTNNLKYGYGIRLDKDLINAIQLNYDELNKFFNYYK